MFIEKRLKDGEITYYVRSVVNGKILFESKEKAEAEKFQRSNKGK